MAFEILGDVIAKVSGQSFDDYVQDHILTPLRMTDSTLLVKRADAQLLTWGHELDANDRPFPSKVFPHTTGSTRRARTFTPTRWTWRAGRSPT
jgi:CubicO group peptidase (beta-lactamase class C family)